MGLGFEYANQIDAFDILFVLRPFPLGQSAFARFGRQFIEAGLESVVEAESNQPPGDFGSQAVGDGIKELVENRI